MRIDKILTPEIILNKRGNQILRDTFQSLLPLIEVSENGGYKILDDSLNTVNNGHLRQALYAAKKWIVDGKNRTFFFPKDFTEALGKVRCNIIPDVIPTGFTAYFSYPENTLKTGSFNACGAFVTVVEDAAILNNLHPDYLKHAEGDKIVQIVIEKIQDIKNSSPISYINVVIGNKLSLEQNLEECFKYGKFEMFTNKADIMHSLKIILNSVLYIHSQFAELEKLRPNKDLTKSQKVKAREAEKENLCTVPLILVNWNYAKEIKRIYKEQTVFVDTYMRWQRYGIKNSLLKLIWVKEHQKEYGGSNENWNKWWNDCRPL